MEPIPAVPVGIQKDLLQAPIVCFTVVVGAMTIVAFSVALFGVAAIRRSGATT